MTLNIAGSVCASANQIFAGSGTVIFGSGRVPRVYPQWWGAYSDGSPHEKETTAAIQAAMKSVFAPKVTKKIKNPATPPATYTLGSSQVVEFLAGHYKINDEIAVGPYANVITGSEAIIEQTDEAKNIFNFQNAYMIRISGLRFIGGYNQISLRQGRVDTLMYQIDHCEFEFARSYAIETTPVPPADHLSAVLTIDHCKFFLPWAVLNNRCDYAAVNNCWVTVNSDYTPQFTAIFVNGSCNSKTNGRLHFCNMFGVPGFSSGSHCRWIDNYGSVFVDDSRFGGEGAGMPIVYHYAKHWNRNGSWPRPPTSVVIRNSWVFTGYNDPNAAALNLQTEVPVVFIYEGNFGPANASDNPIIVNGAVPDLDEYIKKFPHNYFRFVIEPNEMTVHNLPEPLKALVNFIENEKVATSPPTTGMWERGQHLWNKEPTPGGIIGWVCVTSGSPGTWKPFGTIST